LNVVRRNGMITQEESKSYRFRKILEAANTDVARVLELVRDFLADHPDHPGAQLQHGRTLVAMARYDEARLVFRRVIQNAPKDKLPWVYAQLGHLYKAKGAFARAARWYRKAIQLCPGDASLHVFLGAVLAKSGDHEGSLAVHRRAIRCRVGCRDEAYLNLGYVFRAREEYREARKCFKKALRIDPNYSEAQEALADVEGALEIQRKRTTRSVQATGSSAEF